MNKAEELRQWVALSLVKDLGPQAFKMLIQRYQKPEAIFKASTQELRKFKELKRVRAEAIKDPELFREADREIAKALKQKVQIVSRFDEAYPEELKMIYDPPILLYVKGRLPDAGLSKVAVVGSRICSLYGRKMSHGLSRDLARNRVVIVSGLALGIDSAAHEGALEADGITIAVLGGGLSKLYPPQNRNLADRIAEKGAILSEYPMDMEPLKQYFPMRNRIISGLSRGVVVVEAKEKSGALITASLALEEGRDVFAVPGNADSARSQGTNALLKQGARLVTSAEDVLEELKISAVKAGNQAGARKEIPCVGEDEEKILSLMDAGPLHADQLIEDSGLRPQAAIASLSLLEIKGLVKQLPGKYFTRT